jgi:uncharacterized protein (TIGR02145 family)
MRLFTKRGLGRALLLTAVLSVGAVCWVGCDAVDRMSLIGQWESVGNGSSMELFKEGTGVFDNETIHWGINGKRLIISDGTNTSTGDYKISGYVLTIAYPEGDAIWVRKGKTEEFKKKKVVEEEKETKTSGGGGGGNVVGQWEMVFDGSTMELFKDGTGSYNSQTINWRVDGKRFIISDGQNTMANDYKVSGSVLTLSDDDGVMRYVRKGKRLEYIEKQLKEVSTYFTDQRDGKKYRAVQIGGKTWMAENLNYQTGNSLCYGKDDSKCNEYGRLYDWNTAKTACPSGWHLPSREEWHGLVAASGGSAAGKSLKSILGGWKARKDGQPGGGFDSFGFSALPGGNYVSGYSSWVGESGFWWTATEIGNGYAYCLSMGYGIDYVSESVDWVYNNKDYNNSVRCLKD